MADERKGADTFPADADPEVYDPSAVTALELAAFPNRGAAEAVRLLLKFTGLGYREQVVSFKAWGKYRKNVKLGRLPVLFDDRTCAEIGTPSAIMRFIARQTGTYGASAAHQAAADAVAQLVESHNLKLSPLVYTSEVDTLKVADFLRGNALVFVATLAKLVGSKTLLFAGDKPTFADFMAYDALDVLQQLRPTILEGKVALQRFMKKIAELPALASYLAERRVGDFAVGGSHTLPTATPVCVTGASGYIASHLVQQLLQRGYTVIGTVRDPDNAAKTAHLTSLEGAAERLRLVKADLLVDGAFDDIVAGCQVVYHTASPFFVTKTDDPERDLLKPAVQGTLNVLKACYAAGAKRVVLTSSTASIYVKKFEPTHMLTEEDWSDEDVCVAINNYYSLSKVQAEKAAWKFVEDAGKKCFKLVVMNPTLVVGPAMQPRVNTSLSVLMGLARKGDNTIRCLVDVRDVALAHIRGAEVKRASGRYMLMSASAPAKIYSDMFWSALPDTVERIVDGTNDKPPVPMYFSCRKAQEELGINFMPVGRSVADSARSCLGRGFLEEFFADKDKDEHK